MTSRLVARANALMFGLLLTVVLLVGALTGERMAAARAAREWAEHSWQVLCALKDLDLALWAAESGQRGYLLTGRDAYLGPYAAARDRVPGLQADLQRLTADDALDQNRLRGLAPLLDRKLDELARTVRLRRDAGPEAALAVVDSDAGRTDMAAIQAILGEMQAEEQTLLVRRQGDLESRAGLVRKLLLGGALLATLALLVAGRMLTRAWSRSAALEGEHRLLALRLRSSLDSISQGLAVFGGDGRLTEWNDGFRVLLGLPQALLRQGTPYAAIARHTAPGGPALETEEAIREGRGTPGEPVVYERMRDDSLPLEIRRTPMPEAGFVLTVTDMTKRAQAEALAREAQKMQAIGQLTGGIAHDFNNLLQVILGNLEIARARIGDPAKLEQRIDRATWAARRGATLTQHLLAFARKQPLAPAPLDLRATLADLLPLLRRTLGEPVDLHHIEAQDLWPAMADPAQLESAVLNLALNARDAMPDGGRLTIELARAVLDADYARRHAEVRAGDYAMLAVSDTGHGMTPDVLARVFEPFFTTKPDGKGTGLGLAMVFGFAKQSGGHVKIYSEPGEGTTVRLYLPRADAPATLAPQPNGAGAPDLPRGTATVLVVEDETAVREIATAILTELGYTVLEAADGEQGLRVLERQAGAVDLLLTDVILPGKMRGAALAERFRTLRPAARVLFMSGYTENAIVHHGRLDPGVQLIGKPFGREQLARKVAEVLAPARERDAAEAAAGSAGHTDLT